MSTRSVLAMPHGDVWRGRYCHSDGYPSWNGRVVWNDVRVAGVEAFHHFISDEGRGACVVSVIYPGFLTAPKEMSWDAKYDDPDRGNFRVYRDRPGETDDKYWTDHESDLGGLEWVYVITPGGLMVGEVMGEHEVDFFALVRWDDPEPDWDALEQARYARSEA